MKKKLLVFAALLVLALVCTSVALAKDVDEGAFVDRGELDEIAKVGGHDVPVGGYVIDWEPDCDDPGRAHFTCDVGDTTHTHFVYINPLGHKWSSKSGNREWGRVIEEPTCTSSGFAIDVCTVCGAEDWETQRIIDPKPHEYDPVLEHYEWDEYIAPSCGEDGEGKGWLHCVHCKTPMPVQLDGSHLIDLPKIPHDWSDWRIFPDSTCLTYGEAARTCIRCGATQYLDEANPVMDHGVQVTIDMVAPLKNPLWNTKLDKEEYKTQLALDQAIEKEGFEWAIKENWLEDCYTRKLTYTCPYCLGTEHDDFTVTLVKPATIAHVWEVEPDPNDSKAPTCTADGYDIYYCIYDNVHGHAEADQFYKVDLPKLGHDWSEWFPADLFKKGDEWYLVSFRTCLRCGAHEQKTEQTDSPIPVKQGLILDDDGVWRYYIDGEVAEDFTDIVPFQGGEFWVVNGEVPADANGMIVCPDGQAYFLSQGQIQRVTQWAEYNGEWFILEDGELADVTGLEYYDGGLFAVESGRKLHVNGLWQDPNNEDVWVFLADGQLVDYTGVVTYDGAEFYVENGFLVEEDDEEVDG